ncbi:MAG: DUF427 domain-containing protein, partial [Nitrospirales bacterium]|nr:DUF427 domain-containing protein [Nitrospirales bacterium]
MSSDQRGASTQQLQFEPSPRWIRVIFNGQVIADSKRMGLLHEPGQLPVYYFPQDDVRMEYLTQTDFHTHSPLKGEATYWTVRVDEKFAENAAWSFTPALPNPVILKDFISFDWDQMD